MSGEITTIEAARLADFEDAERWRKLVRLAGSWQDGSDVTITLWQDDAARIHGINIGDGLALYAPTFAAALDQAVEDATNGDR